MYKEYTVDLDAPQDPQYLEIFQDWCGGTSIGVSPGYAASYLGITRQSVDYACKKGSLRACKIYGKKGKNAFSKRLTEIYIDTASLDAYKELRDLNGGRIPYRAKAI